MTSLDKAATRAIIADFKSKIDEELPNVGVVTTQLCNTMSSVPQYRVTCPESVKRIFAEKMKLLDILNIKASILDALLNNTNGLVWTKHAGRYHTDIEDMLKQLTPYTQVKSCIHAVLFCNNGKPYDSDNPELAGPTHLEQHLLQTCDDARILFDYNLIEPPAECPDPINTKMCVFKWYKLRDN